MCDNYGLSVNLEKCVVMKMSKDEKHGKDNM
jgi:hypothetical protein